MRSRNRKLQNKVDKPTSAPLPLTHEGLGHFAAPSTIAKQYFTSCASAHIVFIL